jgi:hypothetical protein
MVRAIRSIVRFISFGRVLADKQNFRLSPNKDFEPIGRGSLLLRLWKVRFLGCLKSVGGRFMIAVWKFFCKEELGLEVKP